MQDGATAHTTCNVLNYLMSVYDGRIISNKTNKHNGTGIEWPPYSPDLNPCDFFLWGFLKDNVYRHRNDDIYVLAYKIAHFCEELNNSGTLKKVANCAVERFKLCYLADGSHFEGIL